MRRREALALLGGAAALWPLASLAQEAKARRIGFLRVGPPPAAFISGFRQGLRELGLVEGQHFVIEYGLAQSAAQIPDAAAELVGRSIDIIVASGTPSVVPARDAAGRIPVVFVATIFGAAHGSSALLVTDDAEFTALRTQIAELALRAQMPTPPLKCDAIWRIIDISQQS